MSKSDHATVTISLSEVDMQRLVDRIDRFVNEYEDQHIAHRMYKGTIAIIILLPLCAMAMFVSFLMDEAFPECSNYGICAEFYGAACLLVYILLFLLITFDMLKNR